MRPVNQVNQVNLFRHNRFASVFRAVNIGFRFTWFTASMLAGGKRLELREHILELKKKAAIEAGRS